jgi:GGDEF domain-containing protein
MTNPLLHSENADASADAPAEPVGSALFLVQQNNDDQSLTIIEVNAVAAHVLGYSPQEITQRRLEVILGAKVAENLADDLEYEPDAPDLGDFLARQRDIKLRHRSGEEIPVALTITRLMSDGVHARFQIAIPNDREKRANQKVHNFLKLNLEGRKQVDPTTGLITHDTLKDFLPLLQNYLAESDLSVGFAVLRLDRHAKSLARYGDAGCVQLIQHVANCCRSIFRTEDMIFGLSDHTLGLLLFDISRESARVVLNRLRGNIRTHRIQFGGKADFSVTISISFDMLNRDQGDTLLTRCEDAIAQLDADERNGLIELGQ